MKEKPSLESAWPEFDTLWREELSFDPLLPQTWQGREQYRLFAENVYNRLVSKKILKPLLDDAYSDGYDVGFDEGSED